MASMNTQRIKFVALLAATSIASLTVSTVGRSASTDCTSDAVTLASSASVTYVGDSWGPIPIYEVDLRPVVDETIDVAATSPDDARVEAGNALASQMHCGDTTPTTTTTTQTDAAQTAAATSAAQPSATTGAQTTTTAAIPVPDITTTTAAATASTAESGVAYTRSITVTTSPTISLQAGLSATLGSPVVLATKTVYLLGGKHVTLSRATSALRHGSKVHVTLTRKGKAFTATLVSVA